MTARTFAMPVHESRLPLKRYEVRFTFSGLNTVPVDVELEYCGVFDLDTRGAIWIIGIFNGVADAVRSHLCDPTASAPWKLEDWRLGRADVISQRIARAVTAVIDKPVRVVSSRIFNRG